VKSFNIRNYNQRIGNIHRRRLCTNNNINQLEESWKEGSSLEETAYNFINNCEFEKATELLKKSINIRTSKNEEAMDTVRLYQTWTNLGGLYQSQGNYKEAIKTYKYLLDSFDSVISNHNAEMDEQAKQGLSTLKGRALLDYGMANEVTGDYLKCQSIYQDAISIAERTKDDQLNLVSQANLGLLYENLGRYDVALPYHLNLLKNLPVIEIWNHPHFATCLHPLNYVKYQAVTLPFPKEELPTTVREINAEEQKKREHIKMVQEQMEEIHRDQREEAKSELALTEHILKCQEQSLGSDHLRLMSLLIYLATLYRRLENYDQAKKTLDRLSSLVTKKKGESHAVFGTVKLHYGILAITQHDHKLAQIYFKEALTLKTKLLGEKHIHTGLILYDLSLSFWKLWKLEDCLQTLSMSQEILSPSLGPDHPYVKVILKTKNGILDTIISVQEESNLEQTIPNPNTLPNPTTQDLSNTHNKTEVPDSIKYAYGEDLRKHQTIIRNPERKI
jgi:tetratricopeptide (TPR) repeat protein